MFPKVTLEKLNEFNNETMISHLGITFTEVGPDYLCAEMPVSNKTRQPYGLLHGGASVTLAETLGSVASYLLLDEQHLPVGLEINANHIRPAKEGVVTGTVRPLHIGRRTHVWNIDIVNEEKKLIATSRITIAILEKNKNGIGNQE